MLRTYTGFPVTAAVSPDRLFKESYVIPEVDKALAEIVKLGNPTFGYTLETSLKAVSWWIESGGLFNKEVLNYRVELSASERSFILETADLLLGNRCQRQLGWTDWAILLCPSDPKDRAPALWSEAELDKLKALKDMPTPVLIQRWVSNLGIGDLVQSLYLFASPSI